MNVPMSAALPKCEVSSSPIFYFLPFTRLEMLERQRCFAMRVAQS